MTKCDMLCSIFMTGSETPSGSKESTDSRIQLSEDIDYSELEAMLDNANLNMETFLTDLEQSMIEDGRGKDIAVSMVELDDIARVIALIATQDNHPVSIDIRPDVFHVDCTQYNIEATMLDIVDHLDDGREPVLEPVESTSLMEYHIERIEPRLSEDGAIVDIDREDCKLKIDVAFDETGLPHQLSQLFERDRRLAITNIEPPEGVSDKPLYKLTVDVRHDLAGIGA